ncbi:MAG: threonylcarbamoyl-AMP synthase [Ignavibacteriae bacterium]|nr:threonylcarbamoyl-AMP synthase [Ignavibacteriota bacterium]
MTTELLDALNSPDSAIIRAAELLRSGEVVGFPTETVYGLGACIFNETAVRKIYEAKGRPQDNPLIAHIASIEDAKRIAVNIPDEFYRLADAFFPGALTVILRKRKQVPSIVSAGLDTIAVRMPAHEIALRIIAEAGEPLVAPSANRSGKPSPTSAQHVFDDLNGRIAAIVDGGKCRVGIESTIIDILGDIPVIVRPGSITGENIEQILGKKVIIHSAGESPVPIAPGMKYRHYAPQAIVKLKKSWEEISEEIDKNPNYKRMILTTEEAPAKLKDIVFSLSTETIYAEFRRADAESFQEILILCSDTVQTNTALMNRIAKAASGT